MEVSDASDDQLWLVCRKLPSDFEPYGERKRNNQQDCSACRWFQPLLRAGVLDWGVCAHPQSPRAGLLTFSGQGCERFEEADEPTDDQKWRSRVEFKDAVENILIEAHGNYLHMEIGKLNDPRAHDPLWLDHWESSIVGALDHLLHHLLKRAGNFDRRQAAEEVIAELKQESGRSWEIGRRTHVRLLKKKRQLDQAVEAAVRMPNLQGREADFWHRVDNAIRETLEE